MTVSWDAIMTWDVSWDAIMNICTPWDAIMTSYPGTPL